MRPPAPITMTWERPETCQDPIASGHFCPRASCSQTLLYIESNNTWKSASIQAPKRAVCTCAHSHTQHSTWGISIGAQGKRGLTSHTPDKWKIPSWTFAIPESCCGQLAPLSLVLLLSNAHALLGSLNPSACQDPHTFLFLCCAWQLCNHLLLLKQTLGSLTFHP